MNKTTLNLSAFLAASFAASTLVHADTVTEVDGSTNGGGVITATSASNLMATATLSSTDFVSFNNSTGPSNLASLKDGSLGSNNVETNQTALDISGAAWTLAVKLSAVSFISSINVISGWNADASNFDYTLSYSTDGGVTYNPIGEYSAKATGVSGNFDGSQASLAAAYAPVSLESTLSGLNLSGVTNLEFTFNPTDSTPTYFNNPTTYDGAIREIEVIGTPEPSTYALLGMAGIGLFAFRRMNRRQA